MFPRFFVIIRIDGVSVEGKPGSSKTLGLRGHNSRLGLDGSAPAMLVNCDAQNDKNRKHFCVY